MRSSTRCRQRTWRPRTPSRRRCRWPRPGVLRARPRLRDHPPRRHRAGVRRSGDVLVGGGAGPARPEDRTSLQRRQPAGHAPDDLVPGTRQRAAQRRGLGPARDKLHGRVVMHRSVVEMARTVGRNTVVDGRATGPDPRRKQACPRSPERRKQACPRSPERRKQACPRSPERRKQACPRSPELRAGVERGRIPVASTMEAAARWRAPSGRAR